MGEARVGCWSSSGGAAFQRSRIRKGGRGAGQLYMHLEETEEKALLPLPPPLLLPRPTLDPPRLKPNLPPTPPSTTASPLPHHLPRTILKKSPMGQRKKALASLLFGAKENECGSLGLKLILVCSSFTSA